MLPAKITYQWINRLHSLVFTVFSFFLTLKKGEKLTLTQQQVKIEQIYTVQILINYQSY